MLEKYQSGEQEKDSQNIIRSTTLYWCEPWNVGAAKKEKTGKI